MGYEAIRFDVPDEMMKICQPLFNHLKTETGAILFRIFEDGKGSGAFIPEEDYEAINNGIVIARNKSANPPSNSDLRKDT